MYSLQKRGGILIQGESQSCSVYCRCCSDNGAVVIVRSSMGVMRIHCEIKSRIIGWDDGRDLYHRPSVEALYRHSRPL